MQLFGLAMVGVRLFAVIAQAIAIFVMAREPGGRGAGTKHGGFRGRAFAAFVS